MPKPDGRIAGGGLPRPLAAQPVPVGGRQLRRAGLKNRPSANRLDDFADPGNRLPERPRCGESASPKGSRGGPQRSDANPLAVRDRGFAKASPNTPSQRKCLVNRSKTGLKWDSTPVSFDALFAL